LPTVHRPRAWTISITDSRLSPERKGQDSQAGKEKITMIVTGTIRMTIPIAEEGGSALMAACSVN
jgi:hypothetical protein